MLEPFDEITLKDALNNQTSITYASKVADDLELARLETDKANITYVDSQDNLKADITYVDSENQQQKTYIDTQDQALDDRIDNIIAGTVEGVSGAEIVDARGGYDLLGDRLGTFLESRQNYYYVGATQKYQTIQSAIDQWILDGKPTSVVMISKGIYKERIYLNGQSNISFVGEDKDFVIWKTTTGYYEKRTTNYWRKCFDKKYYVYCEYGR